MARLMLKLLGKPESLIRHVTDRPGHDRRYSLDCSKLQALGWRSRHTFEQALEKTVRWYVDNEWWWRKIKSGDYMEYYKKWYGERLAPASSRAHPFSLTYVICFVQRRCVEHVTGCLADRLPLSLPRDRQPVLFLCFLRPADRPRHCTHPPFTPLPAPSTGLPPQIALRKCD